MAVKKATVDATMAKVEAAKAAAPAKEEVKKAAHLHHPIYHIILCTFFHKLCVKK